MPLARRHLAAALALLPLPAAAQLAPGYWSFPDRPALPGTELAALCETGFSVVYDDGIAQSYLRIDSEGGSALWLDSEMTCSGGAEAVCQGWVDNGSGPELRRHSRQARTEAGVLQLTTVVEGEAGGTYVTYPQPCPAEAVRAAFGLGVFPRQ